jgi:hypothetical protein
LPFSYEIHTISTRDHHLPLHHYPLRARLFLVPFNGGGIQVPKPPKPAPGYKINRHWINKRNQAF